MPITGFKCPETFDTISIADAPEYFDSRGIMPSYIVRAIIKGEVDERHTGPRLSPSILVPETTCRRKVVLQRFHDYTPNPLDMWGAYEGIFYHAIMEWGGAEDPKRKYEIRVPTEGTVEVFPGIELSGRIDEMEMRPGAVTIRDLKTTRFPWKKDRATGKPIDYTLNNLDEYAIQLGLYRMIWEGSGGEPISQLFVWRIFRGAYEDPFRKYPVPMYSDTKLEEKIGEFARSLQAYLTAASVAAEAQDQPVLEEVFRSIPMDGHEKQQFNGTHCTKFCSGLRDYCFGLANKAVF